MMRIIQLILLVLVCITGTGCAVFVIGDSARHPDIIERSQQTAVGVAHLWKAEIDSGNYTAASELMRKADGTPMLAIERFDLTDELQRWNKRIGGKPITLTRVDTVSSTSRIVTLTIDNLRAVQCSTVQAGDLWFISQVK